MTKLIDKNWVGANVPRRGANWLAALAKWGFEKRGWRAEGELANHPKMILIVAPHTSNWDFFIGLFTLFALRLRVSFFGKHSIFVPPIGWLLRRLGGIPIERSRAHGVVENIASEIRQHDSMVLALAPEGTRSAVYPWKTGFLHIAKAANIPVQCIGLDYQKKCLVFGPVLHVGDDIDQEMQNVYAFYATVSAKYPENCLVTEPNA